MSKKVEYRKDHKKHILVLSLCQRISYLKPEKPLLSNISTKDYGDDGVWLSNEELDECLE